MSKVFLGRFAFIFAAGALWLTGCSVGPNYVPPTVPQPAKYQESGPWKEANPRDDISKGDWYKVFHDAELTALEEQAQLANQSLRAAAARVSEARALARQSQADFFPSVDFSGTGSRQRTSPNNGQLVAQTPVGTATHPYTFTSATVVPFDLSYEVDVWGKLRRAFESAGASAQASLADYETALLSLKAELATEYFALRTADGQIDVQRRTIESYKQNLDLTNSRFQGGISTQLDVEQAKATLASAQAQLAELDASRAQLEHAIAVLVGVPPEGFVIKFSPLRSGPPSIPAGLPSDLLERRPDVAAAERRVAAQNAQIGVAIAAYFPVIQLTGQTGFDSGDLGLLFNWESRIWSYGPSIQFPIFEGGRIAANIKQQRATYEENVADYRQSVLVAFQNVEDSLSSLRYLAQQEEAENRAFVAYKNALDLTNSRYTTGLVSYFDVIQAQGLELGAEQLTVQIKGNQIATTIQLIKALGGGWADSQLLKPGYGDHVSGPSASPTVLGPAGQQAVPEASMPLPTQPVDH
ncbi:MAG: efflux transporter outer membrane subunit [Methylacidiphilales bacterium]|nr:efflux transporter outer membrane subunit [Candidatus Methylacidiphilales bacterium]